MAGQGEAGGADGGVVGFAGAGAAGLAEVLDGVGAAADGLAGGDEGRRVEGEVVGVGGALGADGE